MQAIEGGKKSKPNHILRNICITAAIIGAGGGGVLVNNNMHKQQPAEPLTLAKVRQRLGDLNDLIVHRTKVQASDAPDGQPGPISHENIVMMMELTNIKPLGSYKTDITSDNTKVQFIGYDTLPTDVPGVSTKDGAANNTPIETRRGAIFIVKDKDTDEQLSVDNRVNKDFGSFVYIPATDPNYNRNASAFFAMQAGQKGHFTFKLTPVDISKVAKSPDAPDDVVKFLSSKTRTHDIPVMKVEGEAKANL